MRELTTKQIDKTIERMRATEQEKNAIRKQLINNNPNARFAIYGLFLRQKSASTKQRI